MHPLVEAWDRWWTGGGGAAALRHAAAWAAALALAVSVASFAPEAAFVWALTSSGEGCGGGAVRVPLDGGGDFVCVPARMAVRSGADIVVPPAFAGLAVGASAWFVRALAIGRRLDDY